MAGVHPVIGAPDVAGVPEQPHLSKGSGKVRERYEKCAGKGWYRYGHGEEGYRNSRT